MASNRRVEPLLQSRGGPDTDLQIIFALHRVSHPGIPSTPLMVTAASLTVGQSSQSRVCRWGAAQ